MFDRELVHSIFVQIDMAIDKIIDRTKFIESADFFTDSPEGAERLDGICMLFTAVGESLKNIDKITKGKLLSQHPGIDWPGIMGFRDVIVHHYFDIDAEQVFWICKYEIKQLSAAIKKMIMEIDSTP